MKDDLLIVGFVLFIVAVVIYSVLYSIIGYSICKSNPWTNSNFPDWNGTSSTKQSNVQMASFIVALVLTYCVYFFGARYAENRYNNY